MFRIMKTNGEELGFADSIRYIKVGASGDYVQSSADEAIGIALKGEPYKLADVVIATVDGGKIIEELTLALNAQTEMQTVNELALAEIAEAQANDQTANELALAELAEMIGG